MHAIVAEILAHSAAAEWRQILHGRRIGGGSCNDDGIVEGALLLEDLDELGDGRTLLSNRNIDAVQFDLLVGLRVERLLIKDRIKRNRGLAGLAVADDQLALAPTDRNQRVNRLQTGRHWLVH